MVLPRVSHGMERMPLEEALDRGLLKVSVTATDDAAAAVHAQVRNISGAAVHTAIPAGWVFTSMDEGIQDLIVVRDELIDLAAGATRTVACRAFCTQGPLRGPGDGDPYRAGGRGAPGLVAVARAIAAGVYEDDVAQSAVWVMSDGYSIAGMGAMDSSTTDTLRMVVSRLSGQPPPRYAMRFRQEHGRMCTGEAESVQRAFEIDVPGGAVMNAVVLNAQGRVMHVLYRHHVLEPGRHPLRFEVPVLGWPPGRYAIHAWTLAAAGVHRLPFLL